MATSVSFLGFLWLSLGSWECCDLVSQAMGLRTLKEVHLGVSIVNSSTSLDIQRVGRIVDRRVRCHLGWGRGSSPQPALACHAEDIMLF